MQSLTVTLFLFWLTLLFSNCRTILAIRHAIHFTSIGLPKFEVSSSQPDNNNIRGFETYYDNLIKLVQKSTSGTHKMPSREEGGYYIHWRSSATKENRYGAQLWGPVDKDGIFEGFDPHFGGKSEIQVRLLSKYPRSPHGYRDVGFHGQALFPTTTDCSTTTTTTTTTNTNENTSSSSSSKECFDVSFVCPDYGCLVAMMKEDVAIPSMATVQITAFAHDVIIFDSIEDFQQSSSSSSSGSVEAAAAAGSSEEEEEEDDVIPTRAFFIIRNSNSNNNNNHYQQSASYAGITGHIVEAELQVNELTGNSFYWALVSTLGGVELDVVIDPNLISAEDGDLEPKAGRLITGMFFLSGRLHKAQRASTTTQTTMI